MRDGCHGTAPGHADQGWPWREGGEELACRLGDAVDRHSVIVALARHHDRLDQAVGALQPGFEFGAALGARDDLDAYDALLARVLEQAGHLPTGQAELLGDVRHGAVEL